MSDPAGGYCPDCEHLLGTDDVVRIVGRHPDGLEPSFRCPACDGEVRHPSAAPADAARYEGPAAPRSPRSAGAFEGRERAVVAAGSPPLDLGDVAAGDRITLHYRAPDLAALQTAAGTVADVERAAGGDIALGVEADTGRAYRLAPDGDLSMDGARAGRVVRLEVRR